jgi:uncharacterized protein (TIRG00374 family)
VLFETVKRWLKFALAVGGSVLFGYFFLRGTDLGEVWDALLEANYLLVPPALVLFGLSLVARAVRWRYLYQPHGDPPWRRLLPPLLVGYAGNNLLPLRMGEVLRAQHLADQDGTPRMHTFGTLMMERLFDAFVLAGFLLWGLALAGVHAAYLGVALFLGIGGVVGTVAGALVARDTRLLSRLMERRLPPLPSAWRRQIGSLGESFFNGFSVLLSPRRFLLGSVFTAIAWGLEIGMYYVISRGFDLGAGFVTVAFAGAAANVAMSVPSAQGGVGPFQFFSKEALARFGIASGPAAAYSLALHFFLVAPVSLVGLFVLWRSALPTRRAALASVPTVSPEPAD